MLYNIKPSYFALPGLKNNVHFRTKTERQNIIIDGICEIFSIDRKALFGKRRDADVVEARHIAMLALRIKNRMSVTDIGRIFNKDHSSVIHACEKINNQVRIYPEYADRINQIINKLL